MHVQQGNTRQYLSNAIQNVTNWGDIGSTINQGLEAGIQITQKANEAKMANFQVDLSTRFLEKNNEINIKYQADPTNPDREKEIKEAFDSLAEQYHINPLCSTQWNNIKDNVYNRYKQYNADWKIKTQQTNAQNDLRNGYESLTNQISMLGMNGASIDEMRLVYANGIEGLKSGAIAVLGENVAGQFLKDSDHDIMTTYISALAVDNPLQAQQLLKDKGVIEDIGNAETIEKLNGYIENSITNQKNRTAFAELGNCLRNMNSKDAENILDGKADLNQVMKFMETNKNLPEGSKDLILNLYGIGSKTEYYYDRDKKKIVKDDEVGSGRKGKGKGNALTALRKLSKTDKEDIAVNLESELYDMFSFDTSGKVNPKKAVKENKGQAHQNNVLSRLGLVAQAQGAIDTALNAGIITKPQRQAMMNKFIQPMTDYLENRIGQLDEKQGWFGQKLGYGRIKKEFSIEGIPASHTNKIREAQRNLLSAQGYYYKNLDTARKQLGLNSIYDLENLDKADQEKIYKKASDMAIDSVKRNSVSPESFFKQEYPQLYAQGVSMFGIKDGNAIAHQVAKTVYGAEDKTKIDVNKEMSKAIVNMSSLKKQQATELVKTILAVNKIHQSKYNEGVLSDLEIEFRAEQLGLTMKELQNDALSKRVSPQMYLIYLENLKRNKK